MPCLSPSCHCNFALARAPSHPSFCSASCAARERSQRDRRLQLHGRRLPGGPRGLRWRPWHCAGPGAARRNEASGLFSAPALERVPLRSTAPRRWPPSPLPSLPGSDPFSTPLLPFSFFASRCSLSPRGQAAVCARLGEKLALLSALEYFDTVKGGLKRLEYYQERRLKGLRLLDETGKSTFDEDIEGMFKRMPGM